MFIVDVAHHMPRHHQRLPHYHLGCCGTRIRSRANQLNPSSASASGRALLGLRSVRYAHYTSPQARLLRGSAATNFGSRLSFVTVVSCGLNHISIYHRRSHLNLSSLIIIGSILRITLNLHRSGSGRAADFSSLG